MSPRGCLHTDPFRDPSQARPVSEEQSFVFPAPVLKDESTPKMTFHYVPIPPDIAESLIAGGTRRVILTVGTASANRYLYQTKDGEYRLIVGLATLKQMGHGPGDVLLASLQPDPDPDRVDIPEEFEEALADHPDARKRFETWTPGKKRSLMMYITQAKRPQARLKRAYELAHKLETYTLYGDKKPTD